MVANKAYSEKSGCSLIKVTAIQLIGIFYTIIFKWIENNRPQQSTKKYERIRLDGKVIIRSCGAPVNGVYMLLIKTLSTGCCVLRITERENIEVKQILFTP